MSKVPTLHLYNPEGSSSLNCAPKASPTSLQSQPCLLTWVHTLWEMLGWNLVYNGLTLRKPVVVPHSKGLEF